jgi:hypothetical protein
MSNTHLTPIRPRRETAGARPAVQALRPAEEHLAQVLAAIAQRTQRRIAPRPTP